MRAGLSRLKSGRWVLVEWDDAVAHSGGWVQPEEALRQHVEQCVTAGRVIEVDERRVLLAMTTGVEWPSEVNQSFAIPLGWVRSVKVIQ